MGVELLGTAVTAFIAFVGFVVWLVRLEGRVNTSDKVIADLSKDLESANASHAIEIASIKAKAEADALSHGKTTLALVRVEEQLKHLTSLVERFFVEGPPPRTRRPSA